MAAAWARSTSSLPAPRSRHTYNWNHLRAVGAAAATSSMEVVPKVDHQLAAGLQGGGGGGRG